MNQPHEELADESPESQLNRWANEYRDQLCSLVSREMDHRLQGRVDASDIVQETFVTANRNLSAYLRDQPLPVYQWLKQIAINCLKDAHRRHLLREKRNVNSEQRLDDGENGSLDVPNAFLAQTAIGPGGQAIEGERHELLRRGLKQMRTDDQEILSLRYDSGLRVKEIAVLLNLSESAVKVRHFRALQRLQIILKELHFDET